MAPTNLQIYFIPLFKNHAKFIKGIEKLQQDFLWQGNGEKKKYHLIKKKWTQVCKSKEESGLGIRAQKEMNLALLGKWLWSMWDESVGLWKQVFFSKYDISREGWQKPG